MTPLQIRIEFWGPTGVRQCVGKDVLERLDRSDGRRGRWTNRVGIIAN